MGLTRTGIEREIRQDLAESMSFAARVTTIADRITTFVARTFALNNRFDSIYIT